MESSAGRRDRRAHAAVAEAQDRSYWLDRWNLDLNALMRRRGAGQLRTAMRAARAAYRAFYNARVSLRRATRVARMRAAAAGRVLGEEQRHGAAITGGPGPSARLKPGAVSERLAGASTATTRVRSWRYSARTPRERPRPHRRGPEDGRSGSGSARAPTPFSVCSGTRSRGLRSTLDGAGDGAVDVAFALSDWRSGTAALQQVDELRGAVRPGGRLVLTAARGSDDHVVTPQVLLAHARPTGASRSTCRAAWRAAGTCTSSSGRELGLGRHPGQGRRSAARARARGRARAGDVELVVIDSGSRDGSPGGRAGGRSRADRDPTGGVRPRAHAQPRRGARLGRADRVPDPGRRARGGLAGCPPRGVYGHRAGRRRLRSASALRDTSPMIARELTEFFAGFSPNGAPVVQRRRRPRLPLERERLLCTRVLGARFASRRALRGGPGLRARDARGRLGQGLPPRSGRHPRARLRAGRVHEALLRRVPRAARDERSRGAAAPARRRARACAGRALDARPADAGRASARAGSGARRCTTPGGGWRPRSARARERLPASVQRSAVARGARVRGARSGRSRRASRCRRRPDPASTRRSCA